MNYYNPMQTYQPNYFQQQPPVQNNGITWVQGESGAKSYMVGAGNNVLLMDSESQRFFIKGADSSGMPMPLRIFEYKEVTAGQVANTAMQEDFIRRSEFDELKAMVTSMRGEDNVKPFV